MNKAPVFRHRHYKVIAALIEEGRVMAGGIAANYYIDLFADMFADDNPRFDRARFLAAANGSPSHARDKVRS